MMYAKAFASMYEGSMVGAGIEVFAVWNYAIAKAFRGIVELNPKLVAMVLGGSASDVQKALDFLTGPDKESRSREADGARLVKEGQFQYRVVNWDHYQRIRNEDERREYNRRAQAEYRSRVARGTVKRRVKKVGATYSERLSEKQSLCEHDWGDEFTRDGAPYRKCALCSLVKPGSDFTFEGEENGAAPSI